MNTQPLKLMIITVGLSAGSHLYGVANQPAPELISPCPESGCHFEIVAEPTPEPQIETLSVVSIAEAAEPQTEPENSFEGFVSYYSEAGCIGCREDQLMANGVKFDENAMTLAFNHLPLNTKVKVINTETGAEVIATVTDRGGFEKYNRIADLSLGLARALSVKTDDTIIKIVELKGE